MKYDESKDFKAEDDLFEPISQPSKDYLRLPLDIKIEFIDSDKGLSHLDDLMNQKYIGVDAEWRPMLHKWHKTKGPCTL